VDRDRLRANLAAAGPSLVAEPLYDEEFALVATRTWHSRSPSATGSDALTGIPLVAYAEEAPIIRRYWRTVFGARFTRTPDVVVPDLRGALTAVLAGAGATVLPTYLCRTHLASGALRQLVEPEMPPLNTLFLVTRAGAAAHPSVRAVCHQLRSLG
jgi:DNA-binding transcriptional LysR family regulator